MLDISGHDRGRRKPRRHHPNAAQNDIAPDRIWLTQASKGGEGGESDAVTEASPDLDYLSRLGLVEGHLLAAVRLYSIGLTDEAVGLAGHPETYNGGALVIEDTLESRSLKLGAGDLIVYPSTSVHRLDPVARGERLALIGWAPAGCGGRIIGKSSSIWSADYSIWRHAAAQPRLLNC